MEAYFRGCTIFATCSCKLLIQGAVKFGEVNVAQPVLQFSDILRRRPVAYYRQLQHVHDTGKYEPWVVFFLNALREAACATCLQIAAEK